MEEPEWQNEEKMSESECTFFIRYAKDASFWNTSSKWTEPMTKENAIAKVQSICSYQNQVAHAYADDGKRIKAFAICHLDSDNKKHFSDYSDWVFGH